MAVVGDGLWPKPARKPGSGVPKVKPVVGAGSVDAGFWSFVADSVVPVGKDFWAGLGVDLRPKQVLAEGLAGKFVVGADGLPVVGDDGFGVVVDELLFGGAAGGGKSFWGLPHIVVEMLRFAGNQGLVLRRMRTSLDMTLWPQLLSLVHGKGFGKFSSKEKCFRFNNGSILWFAGLDTEDDVFKFSGSAFGCIFFEELTEFSESQYTFMLSRLRRPGTLSGFSEGFRPHVISTTNPGGRGHSWVKSRFVKPDPELVGSVVGVVDDKVVDVAQAAAVNVGQRERLLEGVEFSKVLLSEGLVGPNVAWRPVLLEGQVFVGVRCYVPSLLVDNDVLVSSDPGYAGRVAGVAGKGLRLALASGDWDAIDAVDGALWEDAWLRRDTVSCVPSGVKIVDGVVFVDPAATFGSTADESGVVAVGLGDDGFGYVLEDVSFRGSPDEVWRRAFLLASSLGFRRLGAEIDNGGEYVVVTARNVLNKMLEEGLFVRGSRGGSFVAGVVEKGCCPWVPVAVRAGTMGSKLERAKPISVLSKYGLVKFVESGDGLFGREKFVKLKLQLGSWMPHLDKKSPDRLDAFVHACLMLGLVRRNVGRVRELEGVVSSGRLERFAPGGRGLDNQFAAGSVGLPV